MPYETVQEKVVVEKRIKVCGRCRTPIAEVASSSSSDNDLNRRRKYNTVGGMSGSLGASIGASALMGSVLGPVGAIGGAIAGSIVGSKAGRQASDKAYQATIENEKKKNHASESSSDDDLCDACLKILGQGQRLGSAEETSVFSSSSSTEGAQAPPPRERIRQGAQRAGQTIGSGFQWAKNSVTSAIDNAKQQRQTQTNENSAEVDTNHSSYQQRRNSSSKNEKNEQQYC